MLTTEKALVIYVAGPLSAPTRSGQLANVARAIHAHNALLHKGHHPFCPHLSWYADEHHFRATGQRIDYERWLEYDFAIIARCDALLYLAPSPGADRELALATERGMRIFRSVAEIPEVPSLNE